MEDPIEGSESAEEERQATAWHDHELNASRRPEQDRSYQTSAPLVFCSHVLSVGASEVRKGQRKWVGVNGHQDERRGGGGGVIVEAVKGGLIHAERRRKENVPRALQPHSGGTQASRHCAGDVADPAPH